MKSVRLENEYETLLWKENKLVMGIDEAGRGPLCGPLVVASCILPLNYENPLINDSKKLTDKRRRLLYPQILRDAEYYGVRIVSPKEIDEFNIYEATRRAMDDLSKEEKGQSLVLTDAMDLKRKDVISLIKGDARSISIAAASIIAKVTRDMIMEEYDRLYPQYEFAKHKGYPTKRHLELMEKYGLLDIYRMSYGPCHEIKLF
ncbi:MAG: ribonuclease HII [Erysipelotrichaceae bacterium]|nr:ribonuclease HII [Erysipelotrichaceae bacterium]